MIVDSDTYGMARALDEMDGIPPINEWDTEKGEQLISEWEQDLSTEHALKGL